MSRNITARFMAVVILVTSLLQVVLVECRTDSHHAVELVGHAVEASSCAVLAAHDLAGCTHGEHHPGDCDDSALFDPVPPQRTALDPHLPAADALVAILQPMPVWRPVPPGDPAIGFPRCPRPPPDLPKASDAFVTIRLLV